MRVLPAALMLLTAASLSGCTVGEAEVEVAVKMQNENRSCGPQRSGPVKRDCDVEFESAFESATLVDDETGEVVATSGMFVPSEPNLLASNYWDAEFGSVVLPVDRDYEVRVPGCDHQEPVYLGEDDADESVDETVFWIFDDSGTCVESYK